MNTKIMPPTYFYGLLLLSFALHFIAPVVRIVHAPYRYIGILLILFGIVMNLWTDSMFKKSRTTVKPHEEPTSLEVTGPFKISRHPMYLGMVAILLGTAMLLGSVITFIFPLIFIILMEVLYIPMEERNLEKAFGKRYADYRQKVRRWI